MNAILIAEDLAAITSESTITPGRVHSVFEHAVNCTFKESGWMTLLTEESAIGPMGMVVKAQNLKSLPLVAGMKLELGRNRLCIPEAGITVQLKGIPTWNPEAQAVRTYAGLAVRRERLEQLEKWIRKSGNLAGIANVLDYLELPDRSRKLRPETELNAFGQFALERIQSLANALADADEDRLRERIRSIIGFGPGLTPSGDDFLAGIGATAIFLSGLQRKKNPVFRNLPRQIAEESLGRTTRVSEEMLKNLALGRMPKRFMDLQQALLSEEGPEPGAALRELGKMGETSGTDYALGVFVAHCAQGTEKARRMLG